MARKRVEITERQEENVLKKWLWWASAVLLVVSAFITVWTANQVFSSNIFSIGLGEALLKIAIPLVIFGFWVAFAHLLSLNTGTGLIWAVSGLVGIVCFFALTPIFGVVAGVAIILANALFMVAMRKEHEQRIRVSTHRNVEAGLSMFVNLLFLVIAIGIFILYGTEIGKVGLQIPEPLLIQVVEKGLSFGGVNITIEHGEKYGSVLNKAVTQLIKPQIEEQLKDQGKESSEIEIYLKDHNDEFTKMAQEQFFGKFGISGDSEKTFVEVVQASITDSIKTALPLPINLVFPGLLALALFLILHTFAFIFVFIGQGFAWAWFRVLLLFGLIKIDTRQEEVELIRF